MIKKLLKPILTRPRVATAISKQLLHLDNWCYKALNDFLMYTEGGVHPKHRLMNYAQFFIDHVTPQDRVLDIGCGRGTVAARVADRAKSVLGVDLEESNIRHANRLYSKPNLRFQVLDATQETFKDRFDVIVLSNVLEHIEKRPEFLKAIMPLAPKILIRVPMITRDWRVLLKREWELPYLSDKTHYIEYTEEEFHEESKRAGLTIEQLYVRFGEIWAVTKSR